MDVYSVVTDRIIAQLEAGTPPWVRPWAVTESGAPENLASGKPYRGVNSFILAVQPYSTPYWVTFNQARARGGIVRKGEHGTPVVFWHWTEKEKTTPEGPRKARHAWARYYTVFNVEQTQGLAYPAPPSAESRPEPERIAAAEGIVERYAGPGSGGPMVAHGGGRAYYRPGTDAVQMPARAAFGGAAEYYSTLFHELAHSTGHEHRLNRPTLADVCPFGSTNYSKEELVAELAAAMLCARAGIVNEAAQANSSAYLAGWLAKLRSDRRLIVTAAAQAQRAADLIAGIVQTEPETEGE